MADTPSIIIGLIMLAIAAAACTSNDSVTLALPSPDRLATPNRVQTIVINAKVPTDVPGRDAKRHYRDGFKHMRSAEWFSAVAAYSEVIHLHPRAASDYAARGTAHLYGGDHRHAIKDYTITIKKAANNASYCRRRAHAWSTANPHKRKRPSTTPPELSSSNPPITWATFTAPSLTHSCPPLIGTPLWRTWTSQSHCIPDTTARIIGSAPGSTSTWATTPLPNATVNQPNNILDLRPLASQHRPAFGGQLNSGAYHSTSSDHRLLAQGYRRVQSKRRQCELRCHHHRQPPRYRTPSPP